MPPNLLVPCNGPQVLPDGKPLTLALVMLKDAKELNDCKEKHRALSEVVKFREKLTEISKD